ncbi:MAG: hypothetical protein M1155_02330 [Patescibacteria group bacterium]|nr:hypothetical protein [Patescibacteria group bacterium]
MNRLKAYTCSLKLRLFRVLLGTQGFTTFPSWSGFGAVLNGSPVEMKKEIEEIRTLFKFLVPDHCVINGPTFSAGGVYAMYVWPKDDENYRKAHKHYPQMQKMTEASKK